MKIALNEFLFFGFFIMWFLSHLEVDLLKTDNARVAHRVSVPSVANKNSNCQPNPRFTNYFSSWHFQVSAGRTHYMWNVCPSDASQTHAHTSVFYLLRSLIRCPATTCLSIRKQFLSQANKQWFSTPFWERHRPSAFGNCCHRQNSWDTRAGLICQSLWSEVRILAAQMLNNPTSCQPPACQSWLRQQVVRKPTRSDDRMVSNHFNCVAMYVCMCWRPFFPSTPLCPPVRYNSWARTHFRVFLFCYTASECVCLCVCALVH